MKGTCAGTPTVSPAKVLVIACCSASKRIPASVRARDVFAASDSPSSDWFAALEVARDRTRADQLYTGRAFSTLKTAAETTRVDLGIVSAGLGYVHATTEISSYSLTLIEGPDALRNCAPSISPRKWWSEVSAQSPFAGDLGAEVRTHDVTLLALTKPYASMLYEALEGLADVADRVRLIGLGLSRFVPAAFAGSVLPYDRRLEASLVGGSIGEFAARAAAFHVSRYAKHWWDLERERADAQAICERAAPVSLPHRRKASDHEILAAVRKFPGRNSPTAALRRLRLEGIACGSDRLERLMSEGKAA